MADRAELVESTLDMLLEGVAVLDGEGHVAFWNQAARAISGYAAMDLLGRPSPDGLKTLLDGISAHGAQEPGYGAESGHGYLAHARHSMGHDVLVMARLLALRDGLGARIGTAIVFHPAECLDALPHGVTGENEDVEGSQEDLKDRMESLFADFTMGGPSFGVQWITVDQAHELRRTHGAGACEAMLEKVERALSQGLRPAEYMGRWGEDEFLVISHERTAAMLAVHAQVLAGLARTADFRWWGDRISLTVSIGAAQANSAGTLAGLLERAKAAMFSSYQSGGNRITAAPEGDTCSQS